MATSAHKGRFFSFKKNKTERENEILKLRPPQCCLHLKDYRGKKPANLFARVEMMPIPVKGDGRQPQASRARVCRRDNLCLVIEMVRFNTHT